MSFMIKKDFGMFKYGVIWFCLMLISHAHAATTSPMFYRDYWSPLYHGERLAYCDRDDQRCGHDIAQSYCQMMGYDDVRHYRIARNIGLTYYWDRGGQCRGWQCDGFDWIECVGQFTQHEQRALEHQAVQIKRFIYPRDQNHRVDWCYRLHQECGRRAAYAFCRQHGYDAVVSYAVDDKTPATRTLKEGALCYGDTCKGFKFIRCRR